MNAPYYPGHGKPCNGCGICCQQELCPIAMAVFTPNINRMSHVDGPCPALEHDGTRFRCGLIADPAKHAPEQTRKSGVDTLRSAAKYLLGAGNGCDMQVEGLPEDRAYLGRIDNPSLLDQTIAELCAHAWGFWINVPKGKL